MSLHQLKLSQKQGVSARIFFESMCPTLLHMRSDLCQRLGGRYAFKLSGADGGAWTIDFSSLHVLPRARQDAELRISMSAGDFRSLMRGLLDIPAALANGQLLVSGERSLFKNLAALTNPIDTNFTS